MPSKLLSHAGWDQVTAAVGEHHIAAVTDRLFDPIKMANLSHAIAAAVLFYFEEKFIFCWIHRQQETQFYVETRESAELNAVTAVSIFGELTDNATRRRGER